MSNVTKITTNDLKQNERVETGALQINEDWPGLFIRGDNAAYLAQSIDALLDNISEDEKNKNAFLLAHLQGISKIIKGEVLQH
jgi:hypothetical protein